MEVWLADCKVTSCMMDIALRQELISLVEDLTHSGAPSLNEEKMKRLKNICKCEQREIQSPTWPIL